MSKRKEPKKRSKSNQRRVVGLDVHPDSFAGAILAGKDPGTAQVLHTSTRVELKELEQWAKHQTNPEDVLVLAASGNAFAVATRLRTLGRKVVILDSHQAGKIGKVYCATDRVDAIKIARIYLSGLSAQVWQPDAKTLERREVFSAYQGIVKEATRLQQPRKLSGLNEHCLRLGSGFRLCHPSALIRLSKLKDWSPIQLMLLGQLHTGLRAARTRRSQLRRYMAGEILEDRELLRLARLCGLSLVTIYGLSAAIGEITRFPPESQTGRLPRTQPERLPEWELRRRDRLETPWPRPPPRAPHPIGQETPASEQPLAKVGPGGGCPARAQ